MGLGGKERNSFVYFRLLHSNMDFILTKAGWKMPLSQVWGGWLILLGRGQADIQDQGTTHIPHKRILHAHGTQMQPYSSSQYLTVICKKRDTIFIFTNLKLTSSHHESSKERPFMLKASEHFYWEDDMARMCCQRRWQESKTNETRSCEIFALSWWSGGTQTKRPLRAQGSNLAGL